MSTPARPIVLLIVDGFGIGTRPAADAIAAAPMPHWRELLKAWPHASLAASGPAVGLPEGQMGNSEVGHLNIGAGQRVPQDLPRIGAAIADGSLATNEALAAACAAARGGGLHLLTLLGPGGVHANDRHAVAYATAASRAGVERIAVHLFLDGRDTPPRSALDYLADFEQRLALAAPNARIATISGRYFAMDRDNRWERTERAVAAIVGGDDVERAPSAEAAIRDAYARGESDEFVTPTRILAAGATATELRAGDVFIHANFRADRARQLVAALSSQQFSAFKRPAPLPLSLWGATSYAEELDAGVIFPPAVVPSLAGVVAAAGLKQFHVAETEKYAHVTYFLNGGREEPFPGERRLLIPSEHVATYDLAPAMRAAEIADAVVAAVVAGEEALIVANLANPDMVGHTGAWEATLEACAAVDVAIGRIATATLHIPEALLVITGDHGNAEEMRDEGGGVVTSHTLARVPLLLAGRAVEGEQIRDGELRDIAPTLCALGGLTPDPAMTGGSLLVARTARRS